MMNWYSLRVISGKEKSIELNILKQVNENSISDDVEEPGAQNKVL